MQIDEKRREKLKLISKEGDFALYEYKPTLLSPLFIHFEPIKIVRRCRYLLLFLYPGHYLVYYLSYKDNFVAYCVVAPGGRQLKCATTNDIVLGPYYVEKMNRGKGYSTVLIQKVIENYTKPYNNAYDYILKENIPSIKASKRCGFEPFAELNIVGILRKPIIVEHDGKYLVFKYEKK